MTTVATICRSLTHHPLITMNFFHHSYIKQIIYYQIQLKSLLHGPPWNNKLVDPRALFTFHFLFHPPCNAVPSLETPASFRIKLRSETFGSVESGVQCSSVSCSVHSGASRSHSCSRSFASPSQLSLAHVIFLSTPLQPHSNRHPRSSRIHSQR